jgi:hypothetical protein
LPIDSIVDVLREARNSMASCDRSQLRLVYCISEVSVVIPHHVNHEPRFCVILDLVAMQATKRESATCVLCMGRYLPIVGPFHRSCDVVGGLTMSNHCGSASVVTIRTRVYSVQGVVGVMRSWISRARGMRIVETPHAV